MAVGYLLILVLFFSFSDKSRFLHRMCSDKIYLYSLFIVLVLCVVFGFTRQTPDINDFAAKLGFRDMPRSLLFNLALLCFCSTTGLRLMNTLSKLSLKSSKPFLRELCSAGVDLGLLALLVVGLFGSADKFRISASFVHDPWYTAAQIALYLMLAVGALAVLSSSFRGLKLPVGLLALAAFALVALWFVPSFRRRSEVPELQSPWFIPHVCAYILAYTAMAAVSVYALVTWLRPAKGAKERKGSSKHLSASRCDGGELCASEAGTSKVGTSEADASKVGTSEDSALNLCQELVRVGWGFLTMGLAMGALWAKEAWGDYWMWDPKETWALVTWLAYMLIIRLKGRKGRDISFALMLFAFLLLQMCWYGINYLPAAQGASVHLYR